MWHHTRLDHGDDPYDRDFSSTSYPATALLVDQATFVSWTGTDGLQFSGWYAASCSQTLGRRIRELVGP